MKKLSMILMLALFAGLTVMTSCNKDDDDEPQDLRPEISFKGGANYISEDATLAINEAFTIGITASSNANSGKKIENFKLTRTFNNAIWYEWDTTINEAFFSIDVNMFAINVAGEERISLTVTDKDGQSNEVAVNITTEEIGVPVAKYTNITLGSFNDDNGSFYNSDENLVYSIADATTNSAKVDFLFYLGATNGSSLAAPDDTDAQTVYPDLAGWATNNATRFMDSGMGSSEFDQIGNKYMFPDFTGDASAMTQLSSGDVIMFKTANDKLGYIKINSINGRGDQTNIDVIVEM